MSKESLESFDVVLAEVKRVFWGLSTTTGQMKKNNERMQGNLKEKASKNRMMIEVIGTGANRGNIKSKRSITIGPK